MPTDQLLPLSAAEIERLRANLSDPTWPGSGYPHKAVARLLDELERCRVIIDDLATEYAPFSGERCPWCERYPSSDNDWWEPRHHTDDCPFVQARAYLRAVRGE